MSLKLPTYQSPWKEGGGVQALLTLEAYILVTEVNYYTIYSLSSARLYTNTRKGYLPRYNYLYIFLVGVYIKVQINDDFRRK